MPARQEVRQVRCGQNCCLVSHSHGFFTLVEWAGLASGDLHRCDMATHSERRLKRIPIFAGQSNLSEALETSVLLACDRTGHRLEMENVCGVSG